MMVLAWATLAVTMALSTYAFYYTNLFTGHILTPFTGYESYHAILEGRYSNVALEIDPN